MMHHLRIGEEEQRADEVFVEIHENVRVAILPHLLPDAKRAEDFAEDFFAVGFADDFADGVEGGAEFFGDELGERPSVSAR